MLLNIGKTRISGFTHTYKGFGLAKPLTRIKISKANNLIYTSENGFGILVFQNQDRTNISLRNVSSGNPKTTFRCV
jgi:hypothetical protein